MRGRRTRTIVLSGSPLFVRFRPAAVRRFVHCVQATA
jgi:hypothetical protein